MKVLSAEQIREGDAYTIANEPVTSLALMERAAARAAVAVAERFTLEKKLCLFCGRGNNGGDGLAMARMLKPYFKEVRVYIIEEGKATGDFLQNLERLSRTGIEAVALNAENWEKHLSAIPQTDTVLGDALLGTGLSRPVTEGIYEKVIRYINASPAPVFSVDVPSGLSADTDGHLQENAVTVRADVTFTFERPKRAFFFAVNAVFTGRVDVLPIGIHPGYVAQADTSEFLLTPSGVSELLSAPDPFSHKGTFGHALLAGGSHGKSGAMLLATRAAMTAGAGLTTAWVPASVWPVISQQAPEAMGLPVTEEDRLTELPAFPATVSALGIGPGLGTDKATGNLLKRLLAEYAGPLVLDADALNILSENKTWLSFLPSDTILTPHPKEFDRLTQPHATGYERWKSQVEFSRRFGVYVILKGAHTSVSTPLGKTFFNNTGNPGMATGGSGDVLTGILTGLRAQRYPAVDACLLGVFVHGLAGDFAAAEKGREALLASDIIAYLGKAFRSLYR